MRHQAETKFSLISRRSVNSRSRSLSTAEAENVDSVMSTACSCQASKPSTSRLQSPTCHNYAAAFSLCALQTHIQTCSNSLRCTLQILEALKASHATGIVHRDVKPQNVIISETDNKVKFIDMGAAADLRVGINYVPNEYLLDPRYAPPQQYIMSTQVGSLLASLFPCLLGWLGCHCKIAGFAFPISVGLARLSLQGCY